MKIEIDINGVHKDEIEELKKYLEENCWKWEATSSKQQAELDNDSKVGGWAQKPQARRRNYNQA